MEIKCCVMAIVSVLLINCCFVELNSVTIIKLIDDKANIALMQLPLWGVDKAKVFNHKL